MPDELDVRVRERTPNKIVEKFINSPESDNEVPKVEQLPVSPVGSQGDKYQRKTSEGGSRNGSKNLITSQVTKPINENDDFGNLHESSNDGTPLNSSNVTDPDGIIECFSTNARSKSTQDSKKKSKKSSDFFDVLRNIRSDLNVSKMNIKKETKEQSVTDPSLGCENKKGRRGREKSQVKKPSTDKVKGTRPRNVKDLNAEETENSKVENAKGSKTPEEEEHCTLKTASKELETSEFEKSNTECLETSKSKGFEESGTEAEIPRQEPAEDSKAKATEGPKPASLKESQAEEAGKSNKDSAADAKTKQTNSQNVEGVADSTSKDDQSKQNEDTDSKPKVIKSSNIENSDQVEHSRTGGNGQNSITENDKHPKVEEVDNSRTQVAESSQNQMAASSEQDMTDQPNTDNRDEERSDKVETPLMEPSQKVIEKFETLEKGLDGATSLSQCTQSGQSSQPNGGANCVLAVEIEEWDSGSKVTTLTEAPSLDTQASTKQLLLQKEKAGKEHKGVCRCF